MKKYILIILFSFPIILLSQTFIRDYTYNVNESESKIDAREKSLASLRKIVIEEVGALVISNTYVYKDYENDDYINSQINIISESITKTKILEEKWDGYKYYVKAEIIVDKDDLIKRLKRIKIDHNKKQKDNNIKSNVNNNNNNYNNNKIKGFGKVGFSYQPNLSFSFVNFEISATQKGLNIGLYYMTEMSKIDKYENMGFSIGVTLGQNTNFLYNLSFKLGQGSFKYEDENFEFYNISPNFEFDVKVKESNRSFFIGSGIGYIFNKNINKYDNFPDFNGMNFYLTFKII